MRCEGCNKFVSIEMGDPECELEYDGEYITGSVRLVKTCADCGQEVEEANVTVEEEFPFEHEEDCPQVSPEYDMDFDAENSDRAEGYGRYAKTFYGADITVTITCSECEKEIEHSINVEEQASYFDQI